MGKLNVLKMSVSPRLSYRVSLSHLYQVFCLFFFLDTNKLILKCAWKCKEPRISEGIIEEEEQMEYLELQFVSAFEIYFCFGCGGSLLLCVGFL